MSVLQNTGAARRRRRLRWLLVLLAAVISLPLAALYFSVPILCHEDRLGPAEALVVLGGEKTYRPERAFELFQQCSPQFIIISGAGDADEVERYLEGKGVPVTALKMERDSRTTKQNAEFSVKLLRENHIKRTVIITSWFHSRRALNCFRHFAPDIEFVAAPTVADRPTAHWPTKYERGWVLIEYLKLAYYWPRYGISPL